MHKPCWAGVLLGVSGMVVAGVAVAEPKAHRGLTLHGALGVGYLSGSFAMPNDGPREDRALSGSGFAADLWLGAAPARDFQLGVGFAGLDVPRSDFQTWRWVGEQAMIQAVDTTEGRLTLAVAASPRP